MNEREFEQALAGDAERRTRRLPVGRGARRRDGPRGRHVRGRRRAHRQPGLVVTLHDGSEFQVTIVQSRMARG